MYWYSCVVAIAAVNAGVFLFLSMHQSSGAEKDNKEDQELEGYKKHMSRLAGVYVLISFYRTVFLTTSGNRWVWHDTPFSSVLLGRGLATIAELSFVHQLVACTNFCNKQVHEASVKLDNRKAPEGLHKYTEAVMQAMLPLIGLGELFALCGVLNGDRMWFLFDQSCWLLAFALAAPAFYHVFRASRILSKEAHVCTHSASAETFALLAMILSTVYVLWLVINSLPSWWRRYQWQQDNGVPTMKFGTGFIDALVFRVQTRHWKVWRHTVIYLPAFLTITSWSSILMSFAPRLIPKDASDKAKPSDGFLAKLLEPAPAQLAPSTKGSGDSKEDPPQLWPAPPPVHAVPIVPPPPVPIVPVLPVVPEVPHDNSRIRVFDFEMKAK
jgi:hypothetical protein